MKFNKLKFSNIIEETKSREKIPSNDILATKMKSSRQTIENTIKGTSVPSVAKLCVIADYCGVDMNAFFDLSVSAKKKEEPEVNFKVTDGNEYIIARFEQMAQELGAAKAKIAEYEKQEKASYTLQNVQNLSVAEKQAELTKKQT